MKIEKEIWKDIPGFEGLYQASSLGKIKSLDKQVPYKDTGKYVVRKGRMLKPKTSNRGYLEVALSVSGHMFYKRVHRLVAETFISNPEKYTSINHINEIKTDNRVENLEWCTPKQNKEAYTENRTLIYQYDLKGNLLKKWKSITKAATAVNGDKTGVHHCCKGDIKTYMGYIWTFNPITSENFINRCANNKLVKVEQLDLKGNVVNCYDSIAEAARKIKCNASAISMACSGIRNTVKGFRWKKI